MIRLIVFFLLPFVGVQAQSATTPFHRLNTTSEKAKKAFQEGDRHMEKGEYALALSYFERALKVDSIFIDGYFALGNAYFQMRNYYKAETAYEAGLAIAPDLAPVIWLNLADSEWLNENYTESAEHAEKFLSYPRIEEKYKRHAQTLLAYARVAANLKANPVPFDPVNLGPNINSPVGEYFPTLTADGETLLFTRHDSGYDENFYQSQWKDSAWQIPTPLEGINTSLNEGSQAISPDGSWIVYTACNRDRLLNDGSQGSCDLYWSQEKNGAWTKPVPFSKTINSPDWESQPTISSDGQTIIFASRRPGGRGGEDLWITQRQESGRWTKPENLGPKINTPGKDFTPFLHPDGVSLYFCSDSLPGMGGVDIFMSRRQSDGSWGEPQNIGYPINTKGNEAALSVSLDGKTAFYSSDRKGGYGGLDIYSFELPPAVRPLPVTYAKVKVIDAVTRQILQAKLEIVDLSTGKLFTTAHVRKNGVALVSLPAGKSYAVNVNKPGYLFYSDNFNLAENQSNNQPFLLEVALQPIDSISGVPLAGQPVVLRNVFFETGSAALRIESTAELDRLAKLLADNPSLKIQINGHTDDIGDEKSNQTLSEARAKSVYDYLIGKNIDLSRLKYKGFGENKPVVPNDSDQNRQKNRRTEFEAL